MANSLICTRIAVVGLAGLTALGPCSAIAATADVPASDVLQEVVVTATRRVERLQDVAVSVTSFSNEQIDAQGVRSIDDLSKLTPGLSFQRTGVSSSGNYNDESTDISIRGIDSGAGSSTTALYIDDTPIQGRHIPFGAYNAFPQLFDLDRVEVLRGPQGTLFGAGAEGGAVRFITPQPDLSKNSGYLRSEVVSTKGGALGYELGGAVGSPISDDVLGFRASVSYRRDGGYVDRVAWTRPNPANPLSLPVYAGTTESNSNWQETITARVALKWKIGDAVSVTPSFYYQQLQVGDTGGYWVALSNPASGTYRNGNALKNTSTDPFWLASVKLDWDLGFGRLVSNTSYFSRHQHSVSDLTQLDRAIWGQFGLLPNIYPQPGDTSPSPFADKQKNFYQEIRISSSDSNAPLTWSGGIYYAHTNENVSQTETDATLDTEVFNYSGTHFVCSPNPCMNNLTYIAPVDQVVEKQVAVFGELSYKLTDTIKATAGLRYSKIDSDSLFVIATAGNQLPYLTQATSASDKPVTPKVALAWQPDRDDLVYLSAAKGFRQGGANTPLYTFTGCGGDAAASGLQIPPSGVVLPPPYTSDSLWSYELGAKNTLFNRRMQINSSVFYIDWQNIQQSIYFPSCGYSFVANAGAAKSKGGEIEFTVRATSSLTLGATIAYVDAYFTKASCAGTLAFNGVSCANPAGATYSPIVSAGDHLVGSPWTALLSAEYAPHLNVFGGSTGYVRVDYQHTSAQSDLLPGQNAKNALYDTTIPGLPTTQNVNLRAGMRLYGLDLSVFANNLTNEHPVLFASRDSTNAAVDNLYYGRSVRPRTIGLTATYRY